VTKIKAKTFFISSKWRNRDKVVELTEKLRALEFKVISFLEYPINKEVVTRDPEEAMKEWESTPDWGKNLRVRQVAEEDDRSIRKADSLILLLPAGVSAHLEAGYARGLGKECILIGKPEKTESGYLRFKAIYETIDEFIDALRLTKRTG
jgi:nucleoside 2-deoxyribosyltransferase